MHRFSLSILLVFLIVASSNAQKMPVDFVNPFIGTGGHGHTYPGATLPFGMVQLSPDTRLEGWDGCGGYHYDDSYIYGFSHTHLNGTGVPDYCDILFAPSTGNSTWNNGSDGEKGYGSKFRHETEVAQAGYYKVLLDDYSIVAELTATPRVGMHCYTFPESNESNILVDLFHRDEVLESSLKVISNTQIEGLRRSKSWAENQYVYFVAEFSKPFVSYELGVNNRSVGTNSEVSDVKNLKAVFRFETAKNEQIIVKVGISGVSTEGARLNLKTELPGWNFQETREKAKSIWNNELSKIVVEGGSETNKVVFYTALYHTMVNPNIYMDVDGNYRGRDLKIHNDKSFNNYTVFSLWDTYRAFHPLMTIIDQKRTLDYIKTFLRQYEQGGLLPVWELSANETFCMIGYHSIPVIVDAYLKGIKGFDEEKALQAMLKSAYREGNMGLKALEKNGLISVEDEAESVSKTLEYSYDDWGIAQFADAIGKKDDYHHFIKRGQNFKNLYDPTTGFMRARSNGGWFHPFDPFEVNFNYTEANSWQYSFSAVQDIDGLIKLHGSKEKLAQRLDDLFQVTSQTSGRDQSDITGLIGQYAHGNEPSHHMAYLYPFVGQAWKTQKYVNQILTTLYHNNPDGLSGNEDCGQMSAWAVMSAMGFYPVTPGTDYYVLGAPWFDKVTINLENGKSFEIKADNLSANNYYVQSASLNGKIYSASYLKHADIMRGGKFVFSMGNTPNTSWGAGSGNEPTTSISENLMLPLPAITDATKSFKGSKTISFTSVDNSKVYYSIGGTKSVLYSKPFSIDKSCKISFYAQSGKTKSGIVTAEFIRMEDDKDIVLINPPANQYSAGGANNLVDGVRCSPDFRIGGWLGFEKANLEAIIDLRKPKVVSSFGIGLFQDINAWIFFPSRIEVLISDNGIDFKPLTQINNDIALDRDGGILKTFEVKTSPVKTRYVKFIAVNIGNCPPGHKGNGGPAWLFSDEIIIK